MSIAATDLLLYCPASVPIDDVSTTGGAIDATNRPIFTQFSSNAILQVVSDGADTRVVAVTGRGASGSILTENITLNGTTPVNGVNTYERIESIVIGATSGTRTVTCKQGAGGSTCCTVPPNEVGVKMFFQRSQSASSITNRYEKCFYLNNNGSLSLISPNITLTADPAARITVGCATAQNDTGTVANRTTAPGGVTFVDDNIGQNVPGGDLAAASKIGVWINQTLPANDPVNRTTFTLQLAGGST